MISKTAFISWGIIVLMISLLIYNHYRPGQYDDFAKCLDEKNALFYGAIWCPACKQQKELFGKSSQYLPYIECAIPGSQKLIDACEKVGIKAFPTWFFDDGTKQEGVLTVNYLAQKTGCEIK